MSIFDKQLGMTKPSLSTNMCGDKDEKVIHIS